MKLFNLLYFVLIVNLHCHARQAGHDAKSRNAPEFNGPPSNKRFTAAWWDQFWLHFRGPSSVGIQNAFLSAQDWNSYSGQQIPSEESYHLTITSVATIGEGNNRKTLHKETIEIEVGPDGVILGTRRIIVQSDGGERERPIPAATEEPQHTAITTPKDPSKVRQWSSTTTQAPRIQEGGSELHEEYLRDLEKNRRRAQSQAHSFLNHGSPSSASSRASLSPDGAAKYSMWVQTSAHGGSDGRDCTGTGQRHASGSSSSDGFKLLPGKDTLIS